MHRDTLGLFDLPVQHPLQQRGLRLVSAVHRNAHGLLLPHVADHVYRGEWVRMELRGHDDRLQLAHRLELVQRRVRLHLELGLKRHGDGLQLEHHPDHLPERDRLLLDERRHDLRRLADFVLRSLYGCM